MTGEEEWEELFGEWGNGSDGSPLPLTVETFRDQGQLGPRFDEPESLPGLPQIPQRRRVRTSEGFDTLSSTTVYAPLRLLEHFTLGSRVTLAGGRVATVLGVANLDVEGLPSHVEVMLE